MRDWVLTLIAFVCAAISIGLAVRERKRSGGPWISKNPDDYH